MSPSMVAFVPYGPDEPTRVALASPRFACLASDPDADHPDAQVVPDEADLRRALLDTVERLISPAIEPMSRRTHLGAKALWGIAASATLEPIAETRAKRGDHAAAVSEAEALLALGGPLCLAPPTYEVVSSDSRTHLVSRLGVCCRAYLYPGGVHDKCDTCPIRSREDRIARQLRNAGLDHPAEEVVAGSAGGSTRSSG
jgi:hypothetical protein